jgi:microcompartment protein CcmL/EutN
MSQRALTSRTVDTVSEERDLGCREKSPDLEELEIGRVRPDVNEVNNETASQSVPDVEVPNLQRDSSDKDKNSKGEETPSSETTMMMNMIQQLLQRSDQQFQAQEETKERVKQAQEVRPAISGVGREG